MKINLYNRDGAELWLEKIKDISEGVTEWRLYVDSKHLYCLNYMRCIGDFLNNIEAVDPSGGPMIGLGDIFENKYQMFKIINPTTFWMRERNNN